MLVLAASVALLVVLTGGYNVAATDRHNPVVAWALDTTFHNSVRGRADGLTAPRFTPAMVQAGAGESKAMCQHCHGGVGADRAGRAQGTRPTPPALANARGGVGRGRSVLAGQARRQDERNARLPPAAR